MIYPETNNISDFPRESIPEADEVVDLTDSDLARITRLRLVTDTGFPFFDLSYCYGELKDGTAVRVRLPWHQFSRRYLNRDLVTMCKEVGVYAKGLGLLDPDVQSKLW